MAKAPPRLRPQSFRARVVVGALIGLGVGGALAALRRTYAFEALEWRLVDARTEATIGRRAPDPDIVLAVVKNEDLAALKEVEGEEWPWSWETQAYAFEWMAEAGARVVLVDVLYFDRGSSAAERGMDPASFAGQQANGDAEASGLLAAAYEAGGRGRVVMAIELSQAPPEAGAAAAELRRPEFEKRITVFPPLDVTPGIVRPYVNLPIVTLLRASRSVGFANANTDADGVFRRAVPVAEVAGRRVPSLALAGLMVGRDDVEFETDRVRVGDVEQRVSQDGSFLVAYRGREDAYPYVRPANVVRAGFTTREAREKDPSAPLATVGDASPERVRGKYVVWGDNAAGFKDVLAVPVSSNYPGPEAHATMLDDLLHGDGRVEVPPVLNAALLLATCVLFGAAGGGARRRGLFAAALVLLGAALWLGAYRLFARGVSIDLFTPSLGLVFTYAGVTGFRALTEGRRNKWLEGTFGQYLSPAVIDALKRDPSLLVLGGRKRELTVLFSDVKGFTSISEALEEQALVRLLNDYLTRQSERVLAEDGVIDKFIGDAVMAFFGDPVAYADHAVRACRAAVRSLDAVAETQPLAQALGVAPIANRIGLASGLAVVGNIGSVRRFNYTAIGDTVNLASRLEGANKAFGSRILLSEGTHDAARDAIVSKPLARLIVVGKSEPIAVHELLAMREDASPSTFAHAEAFARAHAAVIADDLDAAERHLADADVARPGDGPVAWLRRIVADLRSGVLRRPWAGILVLDTK